MCLGLEFGQRAEDRKLKNREVDGGEGISGGKVKGWVTTEFFYLTHSSTAEFESYSVQYVLPDSILCSEVKTERIIMTRIPIGAWLFD